MSLKGEKTRRNFFKKWFFDIKMGFYPLQWLSVILKEWVMLVYIKSTLVMLVYISHVSLLREVSEEPKKPKEGTNKWFFDIVKSFHFFHVHFFKKSSSKFKFHAKKFLFFSCPFFSNFWTRYESRYVN